MSMLQEFRKFAVKGNMVDMAVGIIIGGAFGKIVGSLVNDVLMPPLGQLLGNVDFSNLFLNLGEGEYATLAEAREAGAATLNYGAFVQAGIDFLIVAFAVFVMVKAVNSMRAREEEKPAAPSAPSAEEKLLTEIRDALRAR